MVENRRELERIFYNGLFENLRWLKCLDIGKNSIGTKEPIYPDEIFCHLKSLQTLKIDGISGASFGKGFRYLTKLRLLRIYNMGLVGYSSDYFENVSQITSLDLSCTLTPNNEEGCYLRRIEAGAIAKLQKLQYLDISHNLKLGFCGLRNVTYDLTKTQIKVLRARKITCPYGYRPVCNVSKVKILDISGNLRYFKGYERLHDKPQYTFDAFVSYAEDDRLFVFNEIIEGLENGKGKYLCIHHRNFIPGCDISDNITNAIHESEKIVCLITQKFLESEWCNYELNIARVEGMWSRSGKNMIIIVLMENISKNDLPIQIIELIAHQTYIDYTAYINTDIFIDMLNTAIDH
ncbi:toll-like receptor 4 [Mytilus californianus]|uniref:toll-like receptor 4 n=1 Tax=Mytilus californianus TaxID=6549 RepID=UPI0022456125|nr:toll-like receptor 4 [Mytilus californianus]